MNISVAEVYHRRKGVKLKRRLILYSEQCSHKLMIKRKLSSSLVKVGAARAILYVTVIVMHTIKLHPTSTSPCIYTSLNSLVLTYEL
jgi:hypothetical protein